MLRKNRITVPQTLISVTALITLASLCGTGFVGCEKATSSGGNATATSGGRQFVTIGTAPAGGAFAPVGNAIANVVDANKGELNWKVAPQETKGTQENIRKLQAGEIEFGMANAAISYFANRGEGAWKTPHEVRTCLLYTSDAADE